MISLRVGAIISVLIGAPGCIADGQYIIRGTVHSPEPDGKSKPVPGVRVSADGGRGGGSDPVVTGDDGRFAVTYHFGGVLLPFLSGNDNPDVRFSASGYETRTARLKSDRAESGISRAGCTPCSEGTCCGIEAILEPVGTAASATP
jgi:hypothetical protein